MSLRQDHVSASETPEAAASLDTSEAPSWVLAFPGYGRWNTCGGRNHAAQTLTGNPESMELEKIINLGAEWSLLLPLPLHPANQEGRHWCHAEQVDSSISNARAESRTAFCFPAPLLDLWPFSLQLQQPAGYADFKKNVKEEG